MDSLSDLSTALPGDAPHEPMETCVEIDSISEFVLPDNTPPEQGLRMLTAALNTVLRAVQTFKPKPGSGLDRTLIALHQKPKTWEEFVKTDDFACLSAYVDNHVRVYLERIHANTASGTDLAASFFPVEFTQTWKTAMTCGLFCKLGTTAPVTYSNSWSDFKDLVLASVPHIDPAPLQLHSFMNSLLVDLNMSLPAYNARFNMLLSKLVASKQIGNVKEQVPLIATIYLNSLAGSPLEGLAGPKRPDGTPWVTVESLQSFIADKAAPMGYDERTTVTRSCSTNSHTSHHPAPNSSASGVTGNKRPSSSSDQHGKQKVKMVWCQFHNAFGTHTTDQCLARQRSINPSPTAGAGPSRPPNSPRNPSTTSAHTPTRKGKPTRPTTRSQH
jgi:hypothetical protein